MLDNFRNESYFAYFDMSVRHQYMIVWWKMSAAFTHLHTFNQILQRAIWPPTLLFSKFIACTKIITWRVCTLTPKRASVKCQLSFRYYWPLLSCCFLPVLFLTVQYCTWSSYHPSIISLLYDHFKSQYWFLLYHEYTKFKTLFVFQDMSFLIVEFWQIAVGVHFLIISAPSHSQGFMKK